MRLVLLVPLSLLVGCGGSDSVSTSPPGPTTSLQVVHSSDDGAAPQRWTLTCEPAGGDHPDAEAACRDLAAEPEPFAPIPADAVCTEIYGGPQTATVRGTYRGSPVDLELSRINGCFIAQWERVGALLPAPS